MSGYWPIPKFSQPFYSHRLIGGRRPKVAVPVSPGDGGNVLFLDIDSMRILSTKCNDQLASRQSTARVALYHFFII